MLPADAADPRWLSDTELLNAIEKLIIHPDFIDLELGYEPETMQFYSGCEYGDNLRDVLRVVLIYNRPLSAPAGSDTVENVSSSSDGDLLDALEKLLAKTDSTADYLAYDSDTEEFFWAGCQAASLRDLLRSAINEAPPRTGPGQPFETGTV